MQSLPRCYSFLAGAERGGGEGQLAPRLPMADLASSGCGLVLKILRLLYLSSKYKNELEILQMFPSFYLCSDRMNVRFGSR